MWIDSRSIWSVLWADGWMDVGGAGLEQKGRFWHFPEIGHKGRGAGLVVGRRRRAWPAPGWAAQVKEAMNDPGKGSEWKCNHLKREIKVTFRLHPLPKPQCLPSRKTSETKAPLVPWQPGHHTWRPFSTGPSCSTSRNACHLGLWVCREAGVTPNPHCPPPPTAAASPLPHSSLHFCASPQGASACFLAAALTFFLFF